MKGVCIAGASGFIGLNLVRRLQSDGFGVSVITREDIRQDLVVEKLRNCSIVVNLVGESIAGLWTKRKRDRIYSSRILTSRKLVEAIGASGDRIELLIQVSGVGIYDHQHVHDEGSKQYDDGFLSQVINDWEGELNIIGKSKLRVVVLRLGIVLDKGGGMLDKMMYPLKFKIGFGVKSGDSFPFIQLEDLMNVFMFCIENPEISGIVNVVAPVLATISEFYRELFTVRRGKYILWFNRGFILTLMGESGSLLVKGQMVIPVKLQNAGFVFRYDNIKDALNRACN
jgi:uncharacterized protein (TIGR01777 family)